MLKVSLITLPITNKQYAAGLQKYLEFNVLSSNICAAVNAYCSSLPWNTTGKKVSFVGMRK